MPHFVYNYKDQWLPQAPIKPGVHLLREENRNLAALPRGPPQASGLSKVLSL